MSPIEITVTGTVGANKKGLLRIRGTDQYNRLLSEDIDFLDNYNDAKTSVNYFKTVESVLLANADGNAAGDNLPASGLTWRVRSRPVNYKVRVPDDECTDTVLRDGSELRWRRHHHVFGTRCEPGYDEFRRADRLIR